MVVAVSQKEDFYCVAGAAGVRKMVSSINTLLVSHKVVKYKQYFMMMVRAIIKARATHINEPNILGNPYFIHHIVNMYIFQSHEVVTWYLRVDFYFFSKILFIYS